MKPGYVVAWENFKEAERHVSAETEPAMFNLLFGLLSLTDQVGKDFAAIHASLATLQRPATEAKKPTAKALRRAPAKAKKAASKPAARKGKRSR